MKTSSIFTELKKHPWILAIVIVGHVLLAILLSVNLAHDEKPPQPAAKQHNIIDAVAVDARAFDERNKQKELEEKRKREQALAAEKKRKQELARKKAEEQRRKEEQRQQALAEKKRQDQLKRERAAREKEKALALAKKKEAERKEKEQLEKQRLEKERLEKQRIEKERREQERLQKERLEKERLERERLEKERLAALEAERRRKEEEQRRAEEKAEFERALLEEERRREEAARQAERAARLQTMREGYIIAITQHVESYWRQPVGNIRGQSCEVIVTQLPSGDVIDVKVESCNSDDRFRQSVERAVLRASPLPTPKDPELFERQIYFKFKPQS